MSNDPKMAKAVDKKSNPVWYHSRGQDRLGPFSSRDLKALADAGDIAPETLIWKQGMKDWLPAMKVKGLFPDQLESKLPEAEVQTALTRGQSLKACPSCAEYIKTEAKKCRYCGELIPSEDQLACPSCNIPSATGAVFCVACGFDFRIGAQTAGAGSVPVAQSFRGRLASDAQAATSETLGWILLGIPTATTCLVWGWVGQMNLLQNPSSSLSLLTVLTVVVTTIIMTVEASQLGMGRIEFNGKRGTTPAAWLFFGLLLWIVAFPAYMFARRKYGVANRLLLGLLAALLFIGSIGLMGVAIEQRHQEIRNIFAN